MTFLNQCMRKKLFGNTKPHPKMATGESIQGFVLKGATPLNRKELGRGAYGKVYEVKYCETVCAAKEIHSILIEDVGETERRLVTKKSVRRQKRSPRTNFGSQNWSALAKFGPP